MKDEEDGSMPFKMEDWWSDYVSAFPEEAEQAHGGIGVLSHLLKQQSTQMGIPNTLYSGIGDSNGDGVAGDDPSLIVSATVSAQESETVDQFPCSCMALIHTGPCRNSVVRLRPLDDPSQDTSEGSKGGMVIWGSCTNCVSPFL